MNGLTETPNAKEEHKDETVRAGVCHLARVADAFDLTASWHVIPSHPQWPETYRRVLG